MVDVRSINVVLSFLVVVKNGQVICPFFLRSCFYQYLKNKSLGVVSVLVNDGRCFCHSIPSYTFNLRALHQIPILIISTQLSQFDRVAAKCKALINSHYMYFSCSDLSPVVVADQRLIPMPTLLSMLKITARLWPMWVN